MVRRALTSGAVLLDNDCRHFNQGCCRVARLSFSKSRRNRVIEVEFCYENHVGSADYKIYPIELKERPTKRGGCERL